LCLLLGAETTKGGRMDATPGTRLSLLVRLRNAQDEQAWAEFSVIYSPLIYRLARRKGLQDADAADLVQEVMRAVASAIDRWDPDPARGPFRNWLFRIARNMMINFLASQRRHPQGVGGTVFSCMIEESVVASQEERDHGRLSTRLRRKSPEASTG
jgi:RNA polymerase sigma factor (sigma-70 family)